MIEVEDLDILEQSNLDKYVYNVQHHTGCIYQDSKQMVLTLLKHNPSITIEEVITDCMNMIYFKTRHFNWHGA